MKSVRHFDDPVAAYDRLAPSYAELCRRREPYLRSIETHIVAAIPSGSRSLLDIGAGDGRRVSRIVAEAKIGTVVLVEPSAAMRSQVANIGEVCPARAEDLDPARIAERFDVVTCLWNSLGHVPTSEKRLRALRAIAGLLSPQGLFFLDVIHRYNLRSYGLAATAGRWLRDLISPRDTNGDVTAKWDVGGESLSTYGHVFTHREILRLASAAGLKLQQRLVLDYETGKEHAYACLGNLLYLFRR
jgi:SAM-dependent methyltransferase